MDRCKLNRSIFQLVAALQEGLLDYANPDDPLGVVVEDVLSPLLYPFGISEPFIFLILRMLSETLERYQEPQRRIFRADRTYCGQASVLHFTSSDNATMLHTCSLSE